MSDLPSLNINDGVPSYIADHIAEDGVEKLARESISYISLTNSGVFVVKKAGVEIARLSDTMPMVLLTAQSSIGRMYYSSSYTKGGDNEPATCWSLDGKEPDISSREPQASLCAKCPQNEQGSSSSGIGKACGYKRALAVLLPQIDPEHVFVMRVGGATLFGASETTGETPRFNLQDYLSQFAAKELPVYSVITEASFDKSSDVAKLVFRPVEQKDGSVFLPAKLFNKVKEFATGDAPAVKLVKSDDPYGLANIAELQSSGESATASDRSELTQTSNNAIKESQSENEGGSNEKRQELQKEDPQDKREENQKDEQKELQKEKEVTIDSSDVDAVLAALDGS